MRESTNNIKLQAATDQWTSFVNNHPDGNFFQTPGFVKIISNVPGYKPITLFSQATDGSLNGVLCGVLQSDGKGIKKHFSSRLIIWGGPLTEKNDTAIAEALINVLNYKFGRNAIYTEFRNLFTMDFCKPSFNKTGFSYSPHLNFLVQLDETAKTVKRISESKRKQIKRSIKAGCVISEATSVTEVKEFYSILSDLYKYKVKTPLPPLEPFIVLFENPDLGKIFLIKKEDQILGGIACPTFKGRVIYAWYTANREPKEKIYPGVLATWAPIEYGLNSGFKTFDFLGAGKPDNNYGVREFKSKFGGEQVEYGRYVRINKKIQFQFAKTGFRMLQLLKQV